MLTHEPKEERMNVSGNVHGISVAPVELSAAEENDLQERLEERFREEAERLHPKWVEWVGDQSPADVARILAMTLKNATPEALLAVERLRADYVEYRMANGYFERAEELARMTWCEHD